MGPPHAEDLLAIAHISRPHGVRGELSAHVLAPPVVEPEALINDRSLYLRAPGGELTPCTGVAVRRHQDRWLITLEGIGDRSRAETLRNHDLCLPRAELPELPEGWFWEADLEGLRVIDDRLGELGRAAGLELGQPQPQLVIERGGRRVRVPWVRAFIVKVDPAGGEIRARLPEGMPGIED